MCGTLAHGLPYVAESSRSRDYNEVCRPKGELPLRVADPPSSPPPRDLTPRLGQLGFGLGSVRVRVSVRVRWLGFRAPQHFVPPKGARLYLSRERGFSVPA